MKKTFSDPDREIPLSVSPGLEKKLNNNAPNLEEIRARSKSQVSSKAQWCALSTVQKMSKCSKADAQNSPRSMEQTKDR